ncbi:MAG: hypothetical protein VX589_20570 [Myxococcota bacterium]|nr:hypothetical protein [Myxococcota bacterium]
MTEFTHLRLHCSGCGASLRINMDDAGKHIKCPSCSTLTLSPTPEEVTRLSALNMSAEMLTENRDEAARQSAAL